MQREKRVTAEILIVRTIAQAQTQHLLRRCIAADNSKPVWSELGLVSSELVSSQIQLDTLLIIIFLLLLLFIFGYNGQQQHLGIALD